jgi:hypothetical protein
MTADRSRYGPLVSALGAIVLAVSVFLPWYGLSLTANGIAFAQQLGAQAVSQFGNASLQGELGSFHAGLSALAGHELGTVSAHQVLTNISVVLLILAGLGILIALIPLARPEPLSSGGNGGVICLLGAVSLLCVLYRIVEPPNPADGFLSLSLREGAWLALLGSLAMVLGGLGPRRLASSRVSDSKLESAWAGLSGWTPET